MCRGGELTVPVSFPGVDFTNESLTLTIPAANFPGPQTYTIPPIFSTLNDIIDESEENFALVAKLGPDVPDSFACFQRRDESTLCFGRSGATKIRIADNDCK